jgi:DNA-binding protein YbaB
VLKVSIQPDATGETRLLEEMVLAAVRDAQTRAARQREERMARVMGGLPLPGFS